jgi:hypothetical protein
MVTIRQAAEAANALEEIFHPINITACAKCRTRFNDDDDEPDLPQRGCCGGCSSAGGYIYRDFTSKEDYLKIKEHFWINDSYGFFDPEKLRCNIPRMLRSYTCLVFGTSCGDKLHYTQERKRTALVEAHCKVIKKYKKEKKGFVRNIINYYKGRGD